MRFLPNFLEGRGVACETRNSRSEGGNLPDYYDGRSSGRTVPLGAREPSWSIVIARATPRGFSGGKPPDGPTLAEVLTRQARADEAIRPTEILGLDLLPADVSLGAVNVQLAGQPGRDARLRSSMEAIGGARRYDFVVRTGPTVTTTWLNAVLVYADEAIAPVDVGVIDPRLGRLEAAIASLARCRLQSAAPSPG